MSPEVHGLAVKALTTSAAQGSQLAVVGDIALDAYVVGSVDRISPEAPVPVLLVERKYSRAGCAANVALNVAALFDKFHIQTHLFGFVGKDAAAAELSRHLEPFPSLTPHFLNFKDRGTIQKTRFLAGAQHQLLRVDEETVLPISLAERDSIFARVEAELPALTGVVLQDYAKGLFSAELFRALIALARKNGKPVYVDPNRHTSPELYRGATLVTPNVMEAEALLGHVDLRKGADDAVAHEAARNIQLNFGIENVLLTRGRFGMTLLEMNGELTHFPAVAKAVFDVTGAGDSVIATIAAARSRGLSFKVAALLATAAASVVVGKVGAATASPQEILGVLERLQRAV